MCAVTTAPRDGQRRPVRPNPACPDPDCTEPGCKGECLLADSGYRCEWCDGTDPFTSDPDCQLCRAVRSDIAHAAEAAAGWNASP